jgi:hypothetical protein
MRENSKTTKDAAEFLRSHEKMSALLPAASRILRLQRDCAAILPAMFNACHVLKFEEGQIVISAPNSALATKLKQQLPKLQDELIKRGWQVNGIRQKVQFGKFLGPRPPEKRIEMPAKALSAFSNLDGTLEDSPRNAALKAAVRELIKHHEGR